MSEHRIYEQKKDIKEQNTIDFYNNRALRISQMECPYTAVLLGDQNPEHAKDWNEFEKQYIMPHLKINNTSMVLDIGCGIGRWSETVIPMCDFYLGTDFSEKMIEVAKARCDDLKGSFEFKHLSFQETVSAPVEKKFDRVIICGVCMYINDNELEKCITSLEKHLDEHCIMYFTETIAVEKRLTLCEFPSEALKADYDVIYRTAEQYNELYRPLISKGFKIFKQDFLPHLNNEKGFSETERWYTIFER